MEGLGLPASAQGCPEKFLGGAASATWLPDPGRQLIRAGLAYTLGLPLARRIQVLFCCPGNWAVFPAAWDKLLGHQAGSRQGPMTQKARRRGTNAAQPLHVTPLEFRG